MSMIQQLLIVAGALIALPFVVKLLWRLYLFPLGCWLVATRLFWPKWAAANETLSGILLAASILVFIVAWALRYAAKKRREKECPIMCWQQPQCWTTDKLRFTVKRIKTKRWDHTISPLFL